MTDLGYVKGKTPVKEDVIADVYDKAALIY
jgi:hypothetical protein